VIYASGKSNILIRNLRIDGNRANNSAGNQCGIVLSGSSASQVVECWVENVRNDGIKFQDGSENCTAADSIVSRAGGAGFVIYGSRFITISGNRAENCGKGAFVGGSWAWSDRCSLVNNTFTYGEYGIFVEYSSRLNISGNSCCNNVWGIYLDYNSFESDVTGNNCSNNENGGIYVGKSEWMNNKITITGNLVFYNKDGIKLENAHFCTISGNTVWGKGSSEGCAVVITDGSNNLVSGNLMGMHWAGVGMWGDSDNNSVLSNRFSGCTDAIHIDASTCDLNLLSNNDFLNGGNIVNNGTGTSYGSGNRGGDRSTGMQAGCAVGVIHLGIGGSEQENSVTFPVKFISVPTVILTLGPVENTDVLPGTVWLKSVTTDNFTFGYKFSGNSATDYAENLYWYAFV
jgi:parallel beta-helix repeat protein